MNVGGDPKHPPPPYGPPTGINVTTQGPQPYGFQDPRQQYPPGPGPSAPSTTVTVIQVPTVTHLGPETAFVTCPSCHAQVSTTVTHEASTRTHTIALVMCLFGLWPCCLFPYCMDSCQSSMHHCPACGAFLGAYRN